MKLINKLGLHYNKLHAQWKSAAECQYTIIHTYANCFCLLDASFWIA